MRETDIGEAVCVTIKPVRDEAWHVRQVVYKFFVWRQCRTLETFWRLFLAKRAFARYVAKQ
jgi:hypothetical protein